MTSPTDVLVRYDVDHAVARLTLDSPHNRNALSTAMIDQLLAALARAEEDAGVRAVVLDHTGPVFCSGADLKETAQAIAGGTIPVSRLGDVLLAIWESTKPVLARVAGPARAGGLGLIAAADVALCTQSATFAFTEVRIGVIPSVISATVLPRMDPRAAAELFLTGETFDGVRAAQVGLVSRAVPESELDAALEATLDALRAAAPGALAGAKGLLRGRLTDPRSLLPALAEQSVAYFRSAEGMEGMAAFAAKRPPSWAV
jgi:methylglutaconyl-CoA hydratase